jgi:luciferase-like monooxygenase
MPRTEPASAATSTIAAQIEREVASWPGVVVRPHRFGGIEFTVGRREIGHLHGSRLADIPFPVPVRERLVAEGRAERHHVLPDSGWISVRIRGEHDVPSVVELFRLSYDRPWIHRQSNVRQSLDE